MKRSRSPPTLPCSQCNNLFLLIRMPAVIFALLKVSGLVSKATVYLTQQACRLNVSILYIKNRLCANDPVVDHPQKLKLSVHQRTLASFTRTILLGVHILAPFAKASPKSIEHTPSRRLKGAPSLRAGRVRFSRHKQYLSFFIAFWVNGGKAWL